MRVGQVGLVRRENYPVGSCSGWSFLFGSCFENIPLKNIEITNFLMFFFSFLYHSYQFEGLQGVSQLGPHDAEKRQFLCATIDEKIPHVVHYWVTLRDPLCGTFGSP